MDEHQPPGPGDVAIIGMAGRFPGASDVETFWRNISSGVESFTRFTDEELAASGVDPSVYQQPNYVRVRPVLDDVGEDVPPLVGLLRPEPGQEVGDGVAALDRPDPVPAHDQALPDPVGGEALGEGGAVAFVVGPAVARDPFADEQPIRGGLGRDRRSQPDVTVRPRPAGYGTKIVHRAPFRPPQCRRRASRSGPRAAEHTARYVVNTRFLGDFHRCP